MVKIGRTGLKYTKMFLKGSAILGPLLFNNYVNRMKVDNQITENCEVIQYADDTKIFSASTKEKELFKISRRKTSNVEKLFS